MQKVGSATQTGADSGDGGPPEPRPKAGRPDRGRRTALWLVLGAIGGALAALAVVGLGLALTTAGEPVTETPRFVEESAAAGVHHVYGGEFPFFVGGGVATFDCDGDRRPDLYLAGGSNPAALYRNESPVGGELRFAKVSDPVTELSSVTGAYPIDVDGDGLTDLAVLRNGGNVLLRGLGGCRFERANETWGYDGGDALTAAFSATWEGSAALPTLAFGNYLDLAKAQDRSACADSEVVRPTAGGGTYAAPVPLAPGYCTLSVLFSDWDRSGHTDLRMANDRHYYLDGEEQLWRIESGEPPRLYTRADGWRRLVIWGMGIASYDVTGDGVPEVYLTSQGDNKLQTLANTSGRPTYEDIAIDVGVTATRPYTGGDPLPSTAWHPEFQDVNNDGLVDLFVSKGNVEAQQDFAAKDPSNLLMGQPDGTFVEEGVAAGIASFVRGRGAAVVDLNLDGMPDLVQVNRRVNVSLFRNVGSGTAAEPEAMGHWIAVRPEQPGPNRDAIGSWIELRFGDRTAEREVTIGGGHASGELGWIHFGLGDADGAQVRIRWPDGGASPWMDVAADRFVTIRRGVADPQTWTPAAGASR
jgi:enediyne biosynthesis protein E4